MSSLDWLLIGVITPPLVAVLVCDAVVFIRLKDFEAWFGDHNDRLDR